MSRVSFSLRASGSSLLGILVCLCFSRGLVAADTKATAPNLSAAQVVE